MDANTQIAAASGVLTVGVIAFGYTLKKMTRVSHKKMGVMERRLDDLNVYIRHVGDDLNGLRAGISRKIEAEEGRARISESAQFLATEEKERARAIA
ncbi:MAG: hypothetical protein V1708_00815 [Candidatus Micrarchaeota archaeon]